MKHKIFHFSFFIFLVLPFLVSSQMVTVSKDISIKNDFAYDIFTELGGNIILYRDRGNEYKFEVFDKNLKFQYTQNISLERGRVKIAGIFEDGNEHINIYYSYIDQDGKSLNVKTFNGDGAPVDTVLLAFDNGDLFRKSLGSCISEDKSKALFYRYFNNAIHYFIVDNKTLEVIEYKLLPNGIYNIEKGIAEAAISNEGEVLFILKTKFGYGNDNNYINILYASPNGQPKQLMLDFADNFCQRIEFEIDNVNKRVVLAGLIENDDEFNSDSYFLTSTRFRDIPSTILIEPIKLSENIIIKSGGNDKDNNLEFFFVNKLILRKDGGVLIFGENQKTIYRRSVYSGSRRFNVNDPGNYRNLTDYYHENLFILNINPDGTLAWDETLHKKQYSQDDGGYFSSYFVFKTPSRLRVLYNDEIKANSTMSEYVLDPLGHLERNSVLSTEYQNLRLRVKDAIQINNEEILIPSEKSGKINLVKIKF